MIGTDIIDKRRIATLYQKHGQRLAEKILHPDELAQLPAQKDPGAPTVVVQTMQTARRIAQIHLSLSDEHDYVVAFVWCEAAR